MRINDDPNWIVSLLSAPTLVVATDIVVDKTTGMLAVLKRGCGVQPAECKTISEELRDDAPALSWAWSLIACRGGNRDRILECVRQGLDLAADLHVRHAETVRARLEVWKDIAQLHASSIDVDLFAEAATRWGLDLRGLAERTTPLAKTRSGIPPLIAVLLAPRWDRAAEIAIRETQLWGIGTDHRERDWLDQMTRDHAEGRADCVAMAGRVAVAGHDGLRLCWLLLAADVSELDGLRFLIDEIETKLRGVDWDEYPDLLPRLRVMRAVARGKHAGEFGSLFHLASMHRNSGVREERGPTPHVPVPVLLLMQDRRDAAVSWLWDVMLGDGDIELGEDLAGAKPPGLHDALGSVAWREHVRDIVDALFALGTQQSGEFAIAWMMVSCDPRSPPGFHVMLPQVQRLLDGTWMTNDNREIRQARLDVWWSVAGERKLSSTRRPYDVDVFELAWREVHKDLRGMAGFESLRKSTERVTKKLTVQPSHAVVVLKHANADDKLPSAWKVLIDEALPRVVAGNVGRMRATLHDEYPHATAVIDSLLRDVREGQPVRLTPTILLGPAGTGKSRMVRRIAELVGDLRVTRYDCAAAMDGMFSGSPRAWSNSHPSVPAQAILSARSPSALVMLDEIEKAGTSPHNGRLWDTLVPFLERETSARYRDTGLGVELDLSHISYVATANSVEELPGPLRDRFRILKVPSPTLAHLPKLAGHVLREIKRDEDARSHDEPLAVDELAVIGRAWASERFSMRKLQRIVAATLDARDQQAVRH